MAKAFINRLSTRLNRSSLRQRYLGMALAVSATVVAGSLFTHYHIHQAQERSARNIEHRNQVQLISRSLRNAVWDAEYALQAFILTPTAGSRETVQQRIRSAQMTADKLQQLTWPQQQGLRSTLNEIDRALLELSAVANRLMDEALAPARTDFPIIKNEIQPLFASIWNNLDNIDAIVQETAMRDVTLWNTLAQNLHNGIMLLLALMLITFAVGYIFFQRTVLSPLSTLTRAMNQLAHGQYQERLPAPGSRETRNLLDAFHHMQHMIEQRQNELRHQTLHDSLTGLPNRLLLSDRMQQALLISARDGNPFCLLMMDLDRFKEINDTLGHYVGDEVLREVSRRLNDLLRRSDTIARLGGDEFAVLLPETGVSEAEDIAGKIAATFEGSIRVNDQQLLVDTSIGIAAYPDHGSDTDTLVKRADVAMYMAKNNGLSYSVYSSEHDPHSISRLAMISELRRSIHNGELELHYQPKIDIANGELVGVEALLRWPRWSEVPIEYLIATAEQTGLIRHLTHWVIQRALEQHLAWTRLNIRLPIAVNLSTWNLEHADIDASIGELLERLDVRPEYLELEITENAMLKNPERAQEILQRLSQRGIRLSIDDYGTGFSSLAYLKQMPVSQIKIDRSFVMDMMEDENDAVIVRSTIDLAHNLGLEVVAEGVETADIWDILQILDCDIAQGLHVARPMPAEQFVNWLRQRSQHRADSKQDTA